ncbi:4439_t:CDS:2 [Diversispora eburnea]|uniref:4439_t:CDS:1 n=1 Tax=Diversispora eburnea TaxID=1213867 RepID=A0A9N8ZSN4_9GLOM|nr:4439_t:CDS:2 [Diversispora eburnea]
MTTLISSMKYEPSVIDLTTFQETESEKHILESTCSAILRTLTKRSCTILAQMGSTVRAALDINSIFNMNTNQQIPTNQSSPD